MPMMWRFSTLAQFSKIRAQLVHLTLNVGHPRHLHGKFVINPIDLDLDAIEELYALTRFLPLGALLAGRALLARRPFAASTPSLAGPPTATD
jgi:hypothetical protein